MINFPYFPKPFSPYLRHLYFVSPLYFKYTIFTGIYFHFLFPCNLLFAVLSYYWIVISPDKSGEMIFLIFMIAYKIYRLDTVYDGAKNSIYYTHFKHNRCFDFFPVIFWTFFCFFWPSVLSGCAVKVVKNLCI